MASRRYYEQLEGSQSCRRLASFFTSLTVKRGKNVVTQHFFRGKSIALHEGVSFPVGKVDEIRMYPMSFREFLWGIEEEKLADYIYTGDFDRVNEFHDRYKELLKQYYVTGGMPEVVATYIESRDFTEVRSVQNSILHQYEGDFGRHINAEDLARIRMVWDSLPAQLSKENKKFFFGNIKKGALSELDPESVILGNDIFTEFKGALTEQYVVQQMLAETDFSLFYFSTDKNAYEVDLLIQSGKNVIPVEIKAEENTRAKSLKFYYKKYEPPYVIRTSPLNYVDQGWLVNYPLWAVEKMT